MTQTHFGGRGQGYVTAYTVAPENTVAPVITGTVEEGETLTCSTGTWLRSSATYAYQWMRAGVAISGATAATHVLVAADADQAIKCAVTATNAIGSTSADSNEVTPAAFDPATLFTGAAGAWYDPSDISTLFQDSAGTTPVTATGQPVGKMLDKSGNGRHLLQATAAARPLYTVDGANKYLLFDGVDDTLGVAFAFVQPIERVMAFRATLTHGSVIFSGDNIQKCSVQMLSPDTIRIDAGAQLPMTGFLTATDYVMTERYDGASSRLALDNGGYTTGNAAANGAGAITIGSNGVAGNHTAMRFYGGVAIGRLLTDSEIASMRTWGAARQGRAL